MSGIPNRLRCWVDRSRMFSRLDEKEQNPDYHREP
jgi:hypothetical protein